MTGAAAVETECEFIEVVVEVVELDAALMGAQKPSLEQGGDPVDGGHRDMGRLTARRQVGHPMPVAGLLESAVAAPGIGQDLAVRGARRSGYASFSLWRRPDRPLVNLVLAGEEMPPADLIWETVARPRLTCRMILAAGVSQTKGVGLSFQYLIHFSMAAIKSSTLVTTARRGRSSSFHRQSTRHIPGLSTESGVLTGILRPGCHSSLGPGHGRGNGTAFAHVSWLAFAQASTARK